MNQENNINLSVKDFQIIKGANLSFAPGLNCIIGQSNNGKSALMRAAKACIYNTPGTTSVRLGCSNYAVGLQMNGHTVILQKGTNSVYKIDKDIIGKIGRTQLEEVSNALGIKELMINGVNEQINFWDQMEKPFLLDRSETELFRFIVDSGKDNNVTTALKTITQDRQQITRDITITEGKIQGIEDTLKRQETELLNSEEKIEACNKVIELGPKIKRFNDITSIKNKALQNGKSISDILESKKKLDSIIILAGSKLENIESMYKKLSVINNLKDKINNSQGLLNALNDRMSKITAIKAPDLNERLNKYKLLTNLISSATEAEKAINDLNNKKFPSLSPNFNENVAKLTKLSNIIASITKSKEQIDIYTKDIKGIEKEIKSLNKEIKEIGVCPTCGQPLHNN